MIDEEAPSTKLAPKMPPTVDPVIPEVEEVIMYRLYNPNNGEHLYTSDANEKDSLTKLGWSDEGIGWYAPKTSNMPVYRLNNPNVPGGDHHYTTNTEECAGLVAAGWTNEGIKFYSDDAQGVPLYRQYNPNAATGTHNYTTNLTENNKLISIGWEGEGIGWYGLKK